MKNRRGLIREKLPPAARGGVCPQHPKPGVIRTWHPCRCGIGDPKPGPTVAPPIEERHAVGLSLTPEELTALDTFRAVVGTTRAAAARALFRFGLESEAAKRIGGSR